MTEAQIKEAVALADRLASGWPALEDLNAAVTTIRSLAAEAKLKADLLAGAGEPLTDPHDHPDPHSYKWSQAEMDYINRRVAAAVLRERDALEQPQQEAK